MRKYLRSLIASGVLILGLISAAFGQAKPRAGLSATAPTLEGAPSVKTNQELLEAILRLETKIQTLEKEINSLKRDSAKTRKLLEVQQNRVTKLIVHTGMPL